MAKSMIIESFGIAKWSDNTVTKTNFKEAKNGNSCEIATQFANKKKLGFLFFQSFANQQHFFFGALHLCGDGCKKKKKTAV